VFQLLFSLFLVVVVLGRRRLEGEEEEDAHCISQWMSRKYKSEKTEETTHYDS